MGRLLRRLIVVAFLLWFYSAGAQVTAGFTVQPPAVDCNPAIYNFINTSTGPAPLTYQWNFGVYPGINSVFKDPSTTYLGCGTFKVQLIVTDGTGKRDTASQSVNVYCSPRANFTANNTGGCPPLITTIQSTSTAGSGSITSYLWDYGDGSAGTLSSSLHSYTSSGCKNVTLIVKNTFGCSSDTTINNIVCVTTAPVAAFTSSIASSCSTPFSVSYQDLSNSGKAPYSYYWIFAGGTPNSSSTAAPTVVYNSPGSFSVILIITDANGCTDTLTKNNYVNIPDNKTDFILSNSTGCLPATISVAGSSSVVPKTWQWSVAPLATIVQPLSKNTTINFTTPGTYSICLTADYNAGCIATKCKTVVIRTSPVAGFKINGLLNTCIKPDVITFTDSSSGNHLNYNWSFPGGIPSSANTSSPSAINYTNCGSYSATLTVTDSFGCTDTKTVENYLNIICPADSFTISPNRGCTPLNSVFNSSVSTGNPVTWQWSFGDPSSGVNNTSNKQNPSHVFNGTGCYIVTLTTTNAQGCAATAIPQTVCAGNKPAANLSANPNTTCANDPFQFTNTSTGTNANTTYQWDFTYTPAGFKDQNDSVSPSYIYGDAGMFDVALVVSNYGCNDTVVKDNAVQVLPPVSIPKAIGNCNSNLSITLDGSKSLGAQHYSWSIPGGNPDTANVPIVNVTFPGTGNYTAYLYVSNDTSFCADAEGVNFSITSLKAEFTGDPLAGCAPLNSCMTNESVGASNDRNWVVTDSSGKIIYTNLSGSPCFLFITPGYYNVRLISSSTLGCFDTLFKKNYIAVSQTNPNFAAVSARGCVPFTANFKDLSTTIASTIVKWRWDFGDSLSAANDSSALQNPSHTYNQPGDYTITLSVTENNGCSQTFARNLYIHVSNPMAAFSTTDTFICSNTQCCFVNNSSGEGLTYQWNFSDSTFSFLNNPCHIFTKGGVFTIQLVVTDSSGCSDTATANNLVKVIRPNADFIGDTVSTTCPPLLVRFSNLSSNTNAGVTYHWEFGDGQISTLKSPQHIYNLAGNFDVTLIVTNSSGCADTLVFPQYIHIGGPTAYISTPPTSGCVPHFTCMSAISASVNLTWNFGDGTVQPGSDSVCYTYAIPGTFYPELILNDGVGCIYSLPIGTVTVDGIAANFLMSDSLLCQNGTVQFADSSIGLAIIQSRLWNFGDPSSGLQDTSSLPNPPHFYAANGIYPVTLTISTKNGCVDSVRKKVTVISKPPVNFTVTNSLICAPDTVFFLNKDPITGIVNLWNFGDTSSGGANTSSFQSPSHYYSKPGTYTVELNVSAGGVCTDSFKLPVVVNSFPVVNATPVQSSICFGDSTTITSGGANTYTWSPATGLNVTTGSMVVANPSSATTYLITGISTSGCLDTVSVKVTVRKLPQITAVAANPTVCNGSLTELSANGAANYIWSPLTGLSSLTGSTVNAQPIVAITYTVKGSDTIGCSSLATVSLNVLPKPVLVVLPFDSILCKGDKTTIIAKGASNYVWSPVTGLNSETDSIVTANPSSSITYLVVGSNGVGCKDSLLVPIKVNAKPVAAFIMSDSLLCQNGTVQFTDSSVVITNIQNRYWNFGDPLSGLQDTSSLPNPFHFYSTSGVYPVKLVVTTPTGCADSIGKKVTVVSKPPVNFAVTNSIICAPDTVFFQNKNAIAGIANRWNFGDATSGGANVSSLQSPFHYYSKSGTYTVELNVSAGGVCTDSFKLPVLVNGPPVVTATPFQSSVCAGDITLIKANGANTYSWSPAIGLSATTGSTVVAHISTGTTYTITGTAATGCINTTSVKVTVRSLPIITAMAAKPLVCNGSSTDLTASGAATYTWAPLTGLSSSSGSTVSAQPVGAITYTVTGSDATGCTSSSFVSLDTLSKPRLTILPFDSILCVGDKTTINVKGASNYLWSPVTGLSSANDSIVTANPSVSIIYSVIGINNAGCKDSLSVPVQVNANPVVVTGSDTGICLGQSVRLRASGGNSYEWVPKASLLTANASNPLATPLVTTSYTVTVSNASGCTGNGTSIVTVHPNPVANGGRDTLVCQGDSIILHATGAAYFSWHPNRFLSNADISSPVCTPVSNITYTLTVTDASGCSAGSDVQIKVINSFTIKANPAVILCEGDTTQLFVTGGESYTWSPASSLDNPLSASPHAWPDVTTIYTVTSSDGLCFTSSDTTSVMVDPQPVLSLTANAEIVAGQNIQLQAYGSDGVFSWSPPDFLNCTNCSDPIAVHINKGLTYIVTLTDPAGCRVEDSVRISLTCNDDVVYVPNAFTPNGDNKNDIFRIRTYGLQHLIAFRVFSRWGEMVFETSDISQGWDGTYNGKPCFPAVYDWYLEGACSNGQEIIKKGNVTLIR